MAPRVLVPLAPGVEEMEAVIAIDTLRRGGLEVVSAGVSAREITASRGVRLVCDALWTDIDPSSFDVLIIPGGAGGTEALAADTRVLDAVRRFAESGRIIAAICAGPLVLQAAGVLDGKRATCHPAVREKLSQPVRVESDRVVIDGNIITSQGPGTAMDFALSVMRRVAGDKPAQDVAAGLLI